MYIDTDEESQLSLAEDWLEDAFDHKNDKEEDKKQEEEEEAADD